MVFSSLEFLFIFLPAFMLVYGLVPKKYKNATIFAGSVIFYSVGAISRPVYILLFLLTILFNFIIGEFIYNFRKASKLWLTVGIVFNFWWLIFFKYTGFLFENINALFHAHLPVKDIILPIGISFYTFQSVSYLIDIYRRRARAESNFISYGAYISMFPQLIAGPIVKFRIVSRMLRHRKHTAAMIEEGLKTFTIGLGFKVLIANQIGGLWSDIGNIGFHSISAPLAWMGIIAYSFQLYFDFCGYSYMAIGLGKIMGFELPKNFDHPYMSLTMGEFWRRWHMTLGMWFREYIYIPLGGSRCGKLKTIRNYFIVWAFTGLWHGASWNFIIWGMVLFALIMLERFVIGKYLERFKVLGHLYMLFVIPLTWLVFAVTDISQLGVYFCRLLPFIPQQAYPVLEHDYLKYLGIYWKFFLAGAVFSTDLPERIYKKIKDTIAIKLVLLAVFWLSVYCIYKGMNDPFMYFRF